MSIASTPKTDRVTVEVTPDRMTASLQLKGAASKGPPSEEEVMAALAEACITVDDAVSNRIAEFIRLATAGEPMTTPFVVAEGQPPQHAVDESFVWSETFDAKAAEWQDDSAVNYYTLHAIVTVEKDTEIGTIAPPVSPKAGVDLDGKTLPADGTPQPLAMDQTVRRPSEDSPRVIANASGRVVVENGRLRVDEVLTINGDVDFETGNVDSLVGVNITGGIPDRFAVKSQDSIVVGGSIEAATVTAGGDIHVRRGLLGRNVGLVTAGGEIVAKFGADAHLVAGGDVKIGKQLMNCHVCTLGHLIAADAAVIGGCLVAREGVLTAHLGSDANVPTQIVVGVQPDALREVATIDRRVRRSRELIDRIQTLLQPLLSGEKPLNGTQKEQANALFAKTEEASARAAEDEARRTELIEALYSDDSAQVRVSGTIYPKVVVRIGDRETSFHSKLKGPVALERRKIKNVTEIVAVNTLTGSIKVLKSERQTPASLLEVFELEQEAEETTRR